MSDFVKIEVDYLKANCNFTEDEEKYFGMKAKDKSDVEVSRHLCVSERTVTDLSHSVKNKIIKTAIS